MNRADPKHEFNKSMLVRSGLGTILQERKKKSKLITVGGHKRWFVVKIGGRLLLQQTGVHHVDRQQCIV